MSSTAMRGAAITALLAVTQVGLAADWNNAGGNPGRNGLTTELGPDSANLLWSGGRTSLIAWQPVIEGGRVFMVRQSGWPNQEPGKSPVVAMDLDTGTELWATHIPFNTGEWTTWVAGVLDGRVYASRSGNGASVAAKLYCLDASDGSTLWVSQDKTRAGPYDGVVFAPDGDPIIADFYEIKRFDALDGHTVWSSTRTASVSGTCGAALYGDAVYVIDTTVGGQIVVRYDLETGAKEYSGPKMPGFSIQNTPLVGPDGTIYVSRTQNNPTVDYFYAFADDGFAITEKWHVPAGWSTCSEFGVGPDGSVYMLAPGGKLGRLDPDTGQTLNETPAAIGGGSPRVAVDIEGRVFVSNGGFSDGRFYSYNADLTPRWDVQVTNINIGAPAIGRDGTLVICGIGTDVRAYRTPRLVGDMNCDGAIDFGDINPFVLALTDPLGYQAAFPSCHLYNADVNGDGLLNFDDINPFVALLTG